MNLDNGLDQEKSAASKSNLTSLANSSFHLTLRDQRLIQLQKPSVMGVINVSPDSFYHPTTSLDEALSLAEKMIKAGAQFLDVGGEATNPFIDPSNSPSVEQQIDRVTPVINALRQRFDILISCDTSDPRVMRAAVESGADLINDQRCLQQAGAMQMIAQLEVPVCLMHCFGQPRQPGSSGLIELCTQIKTDLQETILQCQAMGIRQDRLLIDPGFGQGHYGKNVHENYYLLAHLHEFATLGVPILVGWSRKSMIADVLGGVPPEDRLYGSIAAATIAMLKGAAVVRVHDVAETVDAMKVVKSVLALS